MRQLGSRNYGKFLDFYALRIMCSRRSFMFLDNNRQIQQTHGEKDLKSEMEWVTWRWRDGGVQSKEGTKLKDRNTQNCSNRNWDKTPKWPLAKFQGIFVLRCFSLKTRTCRSVPPRRSPFFGAQHSINGESVGQGRAIESADGFLFWGGRRADDRLTVTWHDKLTTDWLTQTDRQTDGLTDWLTDRQTDRQTAIRPCSGGWKDETPLYSWLKHPPVYSSVLTKLLSLTLYPITSDASCLLAKAGCRFKQKLASSPALAPLRAHYAIHLVWYYVLWQADIGSAT